MNTKSRLPGRPLVDDERRLAVRISAACTAAEAAQVRRAAEGCGLTVSRYVLSSALRRRLPASVVTAEYRQAWASLAPLASNINQIARAANERRLIGAPTDSCLAELLDRLPAVAEAVRELRGALLRGGEG